MRPIPSHTQCECGHRWDEHVFNGGCTQRNVGDDLHSEHCMCKAFKLNARTARARANRKAKTEALRSMGLVRVRGALGGVYWE